MSAHTDHLPEAFRHLAPWEVASDALAAVPPPAAPVTDACTVWTAAGTLVDYWTAQADIVRYSATLHVAAAEAAERFKAAGSVYDAYEAARTAAEDMARIQSNLRDAAQRLNEAAATALSGIPLVEPLSRSATAEYDAGTAAAYWTADND